MITGLVVKAFCALARAFLGLLPSAGPVPEWISSLGSAFGYVVDWAASMGVWVPWSVVLPVAAAVVSCMLLGLMIKLGRIVVSFVTLGGGSAG